MSVALMIKLGGEVARRRVVPVATQDVFRLVWLPAATALALRWVPLFESGAEIDRGSLPDVIREVETLHEWFRRSKDADESVLRRVAGLLAELRDLETSGTEVDIFIG